MRRYEPAIRRAVRYRLVDPRLRRVCDTMDICQSVMVSFFLSAGFGEEAAVMAWSFAETYLLGRLTVDARLHGVSRRHPEAGLRARNYVSRRTGASPPASPAKTSSPVCSPSS